MQGHIFLGRQHLPLGQPRFQLAIDLRQLQKLFPRFIHGIDIDDCAGTGAIIFRKLLILVHIFAQHALVFILSAEHFRFLVGKRIAITIHQIGKLALATLNFGKFGQQRGYG